LGAGFRRREGCCEQFGLSRQTVHPAGLRRHGHPEMYVMQVKDLIAKFFQERLGISIDADRAIPQTVGDMTALLEGLFATKSAA